METQTVVKTQEMDLTEMLSGFTGTENYYVSSFGKLKVTDGIQYLREKTDCYWLIDIIESVQHLPAVKKNNSFLVWKIEVDLNKNFKVTAWTDRPYDKDSINVYRQLGEYTDFPLLDFEFYQCDNVLMLKNEY